MNEVILPRRVVPQPAPQLYPGGDCGACVLGGLLGITVAEVYERFQRDGKVEAFSWSETRSALIKAQWQGLLDRVIDTVPIWPIRVDAHLIWGLPAWSMGQQWFSYVRMALDAGYYVTAAVDLDKAGPITEKAGKRLVTEPDHYVMIVGAREREEPIELDSGTKGARILQEVLVSCSSTKTPDEEWVEARGFLRERGGYNVLMARPAMS